MSNTWCKNGHETCPEHNVTDRLSIGIIYLYVEDITSRYDISQYDGLVSVKIVLVTEDG